MSDPNETESEQESVVEEIEPETARETESEADRDVQYEPSSETVEGMDDEHTVTETTQLNEDNYYDTSDQHVNQEIDEFQSDQITTSSSEFPTPETDNNIQSTVELEQENPTDTIQDTVQESETGIADIQNNSIQNDHQDLPFERLEDTNLNADLSENQQSSEQTVIAREEDAQEHTFSHQQNETRIMGTDLFENDISLSLASTISQNDQNLVPTDVADEYEQIPSTQFNKEQNVFPSNSQTFHLEQDHQSPVIQDRVDPDLYGRTRLNELADSPQVITPYLPTFLDQSTNPIHSLNSINPSRTMNRTLNPYSRGYQSRSQKFPKQQKLISRIGDRLSTKFPKLFAFVRSIGIIIGSLIMAPFMIIFGFGLFIITLRNGWRQRKLSKEYRQELRSQGKIPPELTSDSYKVLKRETEYRGRSLSKVAIDKILSEYYLGISIKEICVSTNISIHQISLLINTYLSMSDFQWGNLEENLVQEVGNQNEEEEDRPQQSEPDDSVVEQVIAYREENKSAREIAQLLSLAISDVSAIIDSLQSGDSGLMSHKDQRSMPWTEVEIKFLLRNYGKMTPFEIGEKLGRSRKSVMNKKYDIKVKSRETKLKNEISSKLSNLDLQVIYESDLQKDIVNLHIAELRGFKNIGKIIHKAPRLFKHLVYSVGIDISQYGPNWFKIKKHYLGVYNIHIPKYLQEIITGSLLGDMNIRLQSKSTHHQNQPSLNEYYKILTQIDKIREKEQHSLPLIVKDIVTWNNSNQVVQNLNTATFRVHKSIFEIEWVELLFREFEKNYSITGFIKPIKKGVRADRLKWSCGFDTESSYQLFRIWLDWYTLNGKKVSKRLPDSFKALTPNVLLHWYIGDGTNSTGTLALYTFGFMISDQKRLQKALHEIGVKTELIRKHDKYYIRISKNEENKSTFFEYMSKAKYYNQANELLPHKFDRDLKKQEIIDKLKEDHQEYFDVDADLSWESYFNE